jgi:hypothetical protein
MEEGEVCEENHQGHSGLVVSSFTSPTTPITFIGKPHPGCECHSEVSAFAVGGTFPVQVQLFPATPSPKTKEAAETKEEHCEGICSSHNGICSIT